MTLVDSTVWINYFRGLITVETEKLDELLGSQALAIGDLILTEASFRKLRRLGATVRKTMDTVIATRCIESGYDLLQNDTRSPDT